MTDPPLRVSSLEPPESKPHMHRVWDATADLNWSPSSLFRHSGWRRDRERIVRALHDTQQPFSAQYEFQHCGTHAYVLQSVDDPTQFRVAGSACHHRFCLPCANERSRTIAINVLDRLGDKRARFLTLTLRSTTEGLAELLDKLTDSFSRLRRRAIWRKRVTGGVSFVELKWSDELQRWNVHLHAIVQGLYIKQGLLTQAWKHITGDSLIVDIRAVKDNRTVTRYVTKYACKPLHPSVLHDDDKLREAIVSLKGRRLATTFGDWRGVLLTPSPDEQAWTNLGSLDSMIRQAESGDMDAGTICRSLNVDFAITSASTQMTRAPPASSTPASQQMTLLLTLTPIHRDPVD